MHLYHMTSGFKTPNIARNTRWNCNFSLPFKNLPLMQASSDANSTPKTRTKQSLLGLEYFIF